MTSLFKIHTLLVLFVLVFAVTGCELPRDDSEAPDLPPASELPPTLAPLGAEESTALTEATPVPTVLNVQPTATPVAPATSEPVPSPNEIIAPTAQPPSLQPTSAPNPSQAEQAAVSGELVAPAVVEPTPAEPVVVDANEEPPAESPIAANPPGGDIAGTYSTPGDDFSSGDGTYTVQPGDTLFSISQRYGTTVQAIMAVNRLNSPDVVQVGQVLILPTDDGGYYPPVAPPSAPAGPINVDGFHRVTAGETLFSIAMAYNSSVEAIAAVNNIPYPFVIYAGQELAIPAYGVSPVPPPADGFYPAPGNASPIPPVPGPANPMPGGAGTHTVAPGETLYSIARIYGLNPMELAAANGLANPNQIYVGQVLYLP